MTFKQAQKEEKKITASRFGMLKENGLGVWYYECKTVKKCGSFYHYCRFRGCLMNLFDHRSEKYNKSVYPGRKWDGVWIASELTRTDWKVTVISEAVLDAILTDKNSE